MALPSLAARLCVASILLAIAATRAHAATLDRFFTDEPYRPYAMGTSGAGPSLAADLNGDGLPDLIKYNQFTGFGVRLNLGGFNFAPAVQYSISGGGPFAIAAGDVTADGFQDLVYSRNLAGGVWELVILAGHGDGTLSAGPVLPCGATPNAIQIADVSLDGHPDLIVTNRDDDDVTVYRAVPGGFAPRVDIPTGDGPAGVAVARIDGDGIPDLAVACRGDTTVRLHRGLGGGAFAAISAIPMGRNLAGPIVAADMDGDSDIDLVVGISANAVPCCGLAGICSILRGHGDGTFDPATLHGEGGATSSLAVGDVDGDAIPDIVAMATVQSSTPGTVSAQAVSVLRGVDGWSAAGLRHYVTGPNVVSSTRVSMMLADLDRDGALDAVLGGFDHFAGVLVGNADGTFEGWPLFQLGDFQPNYAAIGDFNHDSRLDLFASGAIQSIGEANVRLGLPDGTFGPPTTVFQNNGFSFTVPRLVDFDKDGNLDVVGLSAGGLQILFGDGNGLFLPGAPQFISLGFVNSMTVADLNNDSWPDVMVAEGFCITSCSGRLAILLGTGGGGIAPPITAFPNEVWTASALVDLNLDGNLDFIGGRVSFGAVQVLLGRGDATFDVGSSLPIMPTFIAAGHLNADAYPDLVVAGSQPNGSNPGIRVFLGDGQGGFGAPTLLSVPGNATTMKDMLIADLDGDGHQDVTWLQLGTVHVARGNGLGQFLPAVIYGSGGAVGVTVADLNDDSRPDLALVCSSARTVGVLYNEHPGYPTAITMSLASAEALPGLARLTWYGAGAADRVTRIERRTETTAWTSLGSPTAEGRDVLRFEDRQVEPGARYAYRLVVRSGTAEEPTPEVWLDIPGNAVFALHGSRPQPSGPDLRVAFSLATHGEAHLELMDVNGRRIDRREVGSLGPGPHVAPLAENQRLPGGVYWIRLVEGSRSATAKVVITN